MKVLREHQIPVCALFAVSALLAVFACAEAARCLRAAVIDPPELGGVCARSFEAANEPLKGFSLSLSGAATWSPLGAGIGSVASTATGNVGS